jgi:hypothetical protein
MPIFYEKDLHKTGLLIRFLSSVEYLQRRYKNGPRRAFKALKEKSVGTPSIALL